MVSIIFLFNLRSPSSLRIFRVTLVVHMVISEHIASSSYSRFSNNLGRVLKIRAAFRPRSYLDFCLFTCAMALRLEHCSRLFGGII